MRDTTAAAALPPGWIEGKNGGRLRPGGGSNTGPRRSTTVVRKALVEALRDPRGGSGKEFFIGLKCGSAEDRRTFANVVTKLIPVEVQGGVGAALTVLVQKYVTVGGELREQSVAVPVDGTCLIGESVERAPIPAPSAAKTDEEREP